MKKQGLYDPQFEHDACGVGFVVDVKGRKSHDIIQQALSVLSNLRHRGACGSEPNTGDGAGILIQVPHVFLRDACAGINIALPGPKEYGVGMVFMPHDMEHRKQCEKVFEEIIAEEGQHFLGWRTVRTDNGSLGPTARFQEPVMRQIFIGRASGLLEDMDFERKLYVIRRRAENMIRYGGKIKGGDQFYVASLSCRTMIYKGMLMSEQVQNFYPELLHPAVESALAVIHSRFSTNTFPSWDRSHPYRYIAHNGEINTLRGNINWTTARQTMCESDLFKDDIKKIMPIISPDGSDSAMFDNCLEFLVLGGRSLPHAMMMMIPEPWANHESMSDEKKAFYEFHSCLMEPWDGPASIAFTDGEVVGAVLDRNGLRPSRYYVTKDDLVVMASEVGVLDIDPADVLYKGRLQPGRMFLINTREGRIISDERLKRNIATEYPYRVWLKRNLIRIEDLPDREADYTRDHSVVQQRQRAFGYTWEDLRMILTPMGQYGVEPLGSMGTDTPLAVLSLKPHPLFNYFKQLFAQVTNPPIDCVREEIVTSGESMLGTKRNLLAPGPASCRQIKLKSPVLTNEDLEKLKYIDQPDFKSVTLPVLYKVSEDGSGMEAALQRLCAQADQAIAEGANILILSDRGIDHDHAAIPSLLAVSTLHHYLVTAGTRMKVGLVVESAEPREVHHFSLLIGYGAGAVNPYLAFDSLHDLIAQGILTDVTPLKAMKNYVKAVSKGIIKTMSKMGVSTVQSYRGAQIFEAIGLNAPFVEKYFEGTPSRVGGIGIEEISREVGERHRRAFPERPVDGEALDSGGQYQWRSDGEFHLFNPETIHRLQLSCRLGSYKLFKDYSSAVNDQSRNLCTLRSLLEFKWASAPIPLEEVESAGEIVKRFKTGAMSYGSISKEAHEALAIAMNRIGGKSNTGEGGEDPARYELLPNGDSMNSAIKQIASGRFGVTSYYLVNAKELQIKMAQGAKPGEGGQLPGQKVYPWIAKTRHSTPGVGLISPPPHHDIYSIEDLGELIHDLKNANRYARISVKLVSEVGVGTVAAGVAKAHADVVLISGYDGGTGASPLSSIKHAGIPWELGLAETHQTLVLNNLRSRIVVEADGQMKTGRDVAIAALLGAEEFGFATAPLVVLGCLMMRVCHLNTCPVGVATQDPELRKKFKGDPAHVVNFMYYIAEELREIMAKLGFRTLNEMVGRSDRLEMKKAVDHWKAKHLDFSALLHQPAVPAHIGRYCQIQQDHGLDKSLDQQVLLDLCAPALERKELVYASLPIRNTNRVVGTILGSELTRRWGQEGLPDDTIHIHFKGSAGQSFGAFIPRGMTLELEGDANDYIGKGLDGGRIIVYPSKKAVFKSEENIVIGNVAFYGAIKGEAYIRGMAGERFCVRNSGVHAIVEAVGDHGCEYMTGGCVVVLGETGRNFAAGMSGGIAYVLDLRGSFPLRCNKQMVKLEYLKRQDEIDELRGMIERFLKYTGSNRAKWVLDLWPDMLKRFFKVIPNDYRRVLVAMAKVREQGLSGEEAVMAAFRENVKDLSRIGGN